MSPRRKFLAAPIATILLVASLCHRRAMAFSVVGTGQDRGMMSEFMGDSSVVGRSILQTRSKGQTPQGSIHGAASWSTRDLSASYWFTAGDAVRVVSSVPKASYELQGRIGRVVATWEKCDVDPTCCCAEQVDTNYAVRVEFPGSVEDSEKEGESFYHYFAEDEITKVV